MKLGFLTGARSEYGVVRNLIKKVSKDSFFAPIIYVTGMHFLQKYGFTINEIKTDGFAPIVKIPCYTENQRDKKDDFTELINALYNAFKVNRPDCLYVVGDRLEAYAGALAAHFLNVPIAHFAGGQITKGAVDNIYRYNISNLASVHFVTNRYAEDRLRQIPIIDPHSVHLVGSSAVDNIYSYLKNPRTLTDLDPRLEKNTYALMTFHSQTIGDFDVPTAMDLSIAEIVGEGKRVLITYPNNDDGSELIIKVIKKWQNHPSIIVIPNLGAKNYYAAIDNCLFVIGNSSSSIIEVPYFDKFSINVGQRQSGRNAPKSVVSTESNMPLLKQTISNIINGVLQIPPQEYIYGKGNSIEKIIEVLKQI